MKETLKKLIIEFQEEKLPEYHARLSPHNIELRKDFITVLYGIRRVGKTYFFYNLCDKIRKKQENELIIYLNFNDERLLNFKTEDFQEILEGYYELFPKNINKSLYLFFDEIQNISKWEMFVSRLFEKKHHHIFVTGSSSKLLSKEISTILRGRSLSYNIKPLIFPEFLVFKNIKISKNLEYSKDKFEFYNLIEEYLVYGGYPDVVKEENMIKKKEILHNFLDLTIFKDLIERYNIRHIDLLHDLIRYLITNVSKMFTAKAFYKIQRQQKNVSEITIREYLGYLQEIGFVKLIEKYSKSLKEKMVNPKKVIIFDNGICSLVLNKETNIEKLLENIIGNSLSEEYNYYITKKSQEIDFFIPEKKLFIQVCYELSTEKTIERECESLCAGLEEIKGSTGFIISYKEEKVMNYRLNNKEYKIRIIPLWKYLTGIYQ